LIGKGAVGNPGYPGYPGDGVPSWVSEQQLSVEQNKNKILLAISNL